MDMPWRRRYYHPEEPSKEADFLLTGIPIIFETCKGRTLTFNQKEALAFTTWRWIALRVPEGLAEVLWHQDPRSSPFYGVTPGNLMTFRPGKRQPPPKSIIPRVRRTLQVLAEHATVLQKSQDGEILHRARVIHPDCKTVEEFDTILIDLRKKGIHMDRYTELFFRGTLEVRDFMNNAPLTYDGTTRITPPGARTYDRLMRSQVSGRNPKESL